MYTINFTGSCQNVYKISVLEYGIPVSMACGFHTLATEFKQNNYIEYQV